MTDSEHEEQRESDQQRGPTVRDRRRIDPETYQVRLDGCPATVEAADEVAMSQLYYIV